MADNTSALPQGWGWVLGLGIALIFLGVIAIGAPHVMTGAAVMALGFVLVFGGIAQFVHAWTEPDWGGRLLEILWAIIYVIAGVAALVKPWHAAIGLTLVFSIFLIADGVARSFWAFQMRPVRGWGWFLFGGVLAILLGILLLMKWPSTGIWAIGLFIGIHILFSGWTMVMLWMAGKDAAAQIDSETAATA